MKKYTTLKEFYPYYLSEHSDKYTKLFHFIGTSFTFFFLFAFIATFNVLYLILIPLSGYGFAWVSHFFIEKNKPATFTYPFFSLVSDYIMFFEILRGKHKIF